MIAADMPSNRFDGDRGGFAYVGWGDGGVGDCGMSNENCGL